MPRNAGETAIHEAGHAVAHIRLEIEQARVTITPDADTLGRVLAAGSQHVWDADAAADMVIAYCAGYGALVAAGLDQEAALAGADRDFDEAVGLIAFWGLTGDLEHWKGRAVTLMSESRNINAVMLVAEHLEREQSLDEDVVDMLVELADGNATQAQFDRYLKLRAHSRA